MTGWLSMDFAPTVLWCYVDNVRPATEAHRNTRKEMISVIFRVFLWQELKCDIAKLLKSSINHRLHRFHRVRSKAVRRLAVSCGQSPASAEWFMAVAKSHWRPREKKIPFPVRKGMDDRLRQRHYSASYDFCPKKIDVTPGSNCLPASDQI